ncbi:MAG: hypothetical protein DRN66_01785 [Candidatus Nanohalarchaeota archaeon]|nr:MAG: hypothetical protein DRN66_01785 [Candidatus Nanohaloarchaeota archaeon]
MDLSVLISSFKIKDFIENHISKNKKINVEFYRSHITNYGQCLESILYSEIEVLFRLMNPSNGKIGISKILLISLSDSYPVAAGMKDQDNNKYISSIVLEPQQTRMIILYAKGLPAFKEETLSAKIEFYDTESKIMKNIIFYDPKKNIMKEPIIKIYRGFQHFLPNKVESNSGSNMI